MKVFLILSAVIIVLVESTERTKSWTVYHRAVSASSSAAAGDWQPRGTIELSISDEDDEPKMTVVNDESIPDSIKEQSLSDSAYYQIKLGDDDTTAIITTVPACSLRRANYRDEIVLQLNARAQPLSVAYMPLVSRLAPASCSAYEGTFPPSPKFQSTISFQTSVAGMTVGRPVKETTTKDKMVSPPPGLKWLSGSPPKKQRSKPADGSGGEEEEEDDPAAENKSPFAFMQKYWYILLPLMIMNLMSAQQEPQPAGAAPQQAAAQAAAPQAAVAAGTPQRRGKKGRK